MKSKQLLSMLLIGALTAGFASCQGDTPADTTEAPEDSVTTAAEPELPAGIEKKDYGTDFNILYPDWGLYIKYFFAPEETTGEVMDDALYKRELLVEEYLGVDITNQCAGTIKDIYPAVQEMVYAGDDTYQMALTHCITNVSNMLTDELLLDLNTTSIDFTADWWNQSAVEELELFGKRYYAVSDYMLPDPNCILFNKSIVRDYKLENPYELVREGKWTLDKMLEMGLAAKVDNGDTVWNREDQYGVTHGSAWYFTSFIYSSGFRLTEKDEDGNLMLSFTLNDRTALMMEKMDAVFNNEMTWEYNENIAEERADISTGKCLFNVNTINQLRNFRNSEVDYGILPYPMMDEQTGGYYTNDWSGLLCVPVTAQNPDMIADVIELLSYYSAETVIPAYFDLVLGEKLSRDEDSKEMLNLIFDNIVFDAGMNYLGFEANMAAFFYIVHGSIILSGGNNFASMVAGSEYGARAEIDAFNKTVAALGQK